ncbi:hypothetical protein Sango_2312800 [Sesamum angolense]|uniref:Integrase catalytic domain-containing protein n=1 Tax=Sesamum angolense TaxID=2727404 RepID=A0AAE1WAJ1_9LAMI|nr:hypothetical protein Sango_2312800 [Sesamum angolense]
MAKEVKLFIKQCAACQQNKYLPHSPYGFLQPLSIPKRVWKDMSMDFICNLPNSNAKTVIWVVVDRLTKFAHFVAMASGFITQLVVILFLSDIYKLCGAPQTIVSDRDLIFVSKFGKELFRLLGTTPAFTSAYHP